MEGISKSCRETDPVSAFPKVLIRSLGQQKQRQL